MTAYAPQAAAIRHGGMAVRRLTTVPSLATNATSIANRMKNVWMALLGAMMRALPAAIESWPSSPRRLVAESKAVVSVCATRRLFRAFVSANDEGSEPSRGSRKDLRDDTSPIIAHVEISKEIVPCIDAAPSR